LLVVQLLPQFRHKASGALRASGVSLTHLLAHLLTKFNSLLLVIRLLGGLDLLAKLADVGLVRVAGLVGPRLRLLRLHLVNELLKQRIDFGGLRRRESEVLVHGLAQPRDLGDDVLLRPLRTGAWPAIAAPCVGRRIISALRGGIARRCGGFGGRSILRAGPGRRADSQAQENEHARCAGFVDHVSHFDSAP